RDTEALMSHLGGATDLSQGLRRNGRRERIVLHTNELEASSSRKKPCSRAGRAARGGREAGRKAPPRRAFPAGAGACPVGLLTSRCRGPRPRSACRPLARS